MHHPHPMESPSDDPKPMEIEKQFAILLAAGHAREDLWVSGSGRVLVDQDAGDLAAHQAVFARAAQAAMEEDGLVTVPPAIHPPHESDPPTRR